MSRTNDRLSEAGVSPSALANRSARIAEDHRGEQLADQLGGLVQPEVALPADLDEVVEEADHAQRRGQEQHQQRRRASIGSPVSRCATR